MDKSADRRESLRRDVETCYHELFGTRPRTGDYHQDFFGDGTRFKGSAGDYAWLEEHVGITEEEDVKWQLIEEDHSFGQTSEEASGDEDELRPWLDDDNAVIAFLESMLSRYRSNRDKFPR